MATDLNQPMLDQASALGTRRPVAWRQADAMQLPFPDGVFAAVVCHFVGGPSCASSGGRADLLARTPHGYHVPARIVQELGQGGFTGPPEIVTLAARSRAGSPRDPAIAFCQGTPLRSEIEVRDASRLGEATDVAAEAIGRRFGLGAVDGKMQAHVITVER